MRRTSFNANPSTIIIQIKDSPKLQAEEHIISKVAAELAEHRSSKTQAQCFLKHTPLACYLPTETQNAVYC